MSGSLAAAAVAGIGIALESGSFAQVMSLGDFVFDGFEIPERVTWGGAHQMTVHKLVGGARVIDTMGPDDAEISWSGVFLSEDASLRADELNEMRKAGDLLELIFTDRYYLVVIRDFTADTQQINHVPYKISCTVLSDQSSQVPAFPLSPTQQVLDDIATAMQFAVVPGIEAAALAVTAVQPILLPVVALSGGAAETVAVAAAIGVAGAAVDAAASIAAGELAALTAASLAAGSLLAATSAIGAIQEMRAAAAASAAAATAVALDAYVSRAAINVALV